MRDRILLVDDDRDIRAAMSELLTECGYRVTTARDGEHAIAKAKRMMPDLIILDLLMPKVGGKEVLIALLQDSKLRDVPVLIMSASSHRTDEFKNFLSKPCHLNELIARVDGLLKEKAEV
jgi:DNA-binding response OmpR family regulator